MAGRSGLRAAHFFKKLPRDITEGTWVGGVVSMVGVVVALALAASITQSYRSVSIKTEVLLDTASARHIELTFNVTMERLPCRFTSIDAFDATGTKKLNITEAIRMQRISSEDGHVLSDKEEEVWTDEPDFDGSEDGEDAGSEDGEDAGSGDSLGMPKPGSVLELSVVPGGGPWVPQPKAAAAPCVDEQESCQAWAKDGQCIANPAFMRAKCQKSCNVCTPTADTQDAQPPAGARDFDTFVAGRELVLVAFGAPWCPWSQKLGPVWDSVYERMREDDVLSETVDLARVDCTQPASRPLCANQSIRAFPTVRVYRAHNAHSHEEYAGERSVDEILLFLHDAVDMHEHELGWHPKTHLSHVSGEGCRISGKVTVSRVPGSLRISAQSRLHSFDPLLMNVTHHVDSLLFVSPGQDVTERLLMADAMVYWRRTSGGAGATLGQGSAGGGMGEAQLRKQSFVMHSQATTLKHYLKVVPTRSLLLGEDQPLDTYQYSSNYAEFSPHRGALEMHSAGESFERATLVPQTVFSYDISPLRIVHRQQAEELGDYLTQLCAVVGGVFTVFGLIDNAVHAGVKAVKQD